MIKNASLAIGLAVGVALSSPAWAVTTVLTLDGDVSTATTNSFVIGANVYDTGLLALTGLGAPLSVSQGDSLDVTVNLVNGPYTVPASPMQFIGLNFFDNPNVSPNFDPLGGNVNSGSFVFKLMGTTVASSSGSCGNCPSLLTYANPGAALTFDSIEATLTFTNLTSAYTFSEVSLSYQLSQPVPEPGAWALWALGLGATTLALRKRRLAVPTGA